MAEVSTSARAPRYIRDKRDNAQNGNGHDELSHKERVELMVKHTGLTRKQAEAEAAEWN